MKIKTILIVFLLAPLTIHSQGFLTTSGKLITDSDGKEVLLRGLGIGGWMLQEPYMLETSGFTRNQQDIRSKIEELVGKEETERFYKGWLSNFCTRNDIDSLAHWGFNSIRLPMHFNLFTLPVEKEPIPGKQTWLSTGFDITDSLLAWCSARHMYLILDLHAAPGGQGNDLPISDRDPAFPSLWQSDANQEKTIELWRKLAEHYAKSPWIGGYDLLNEPNWNFDGKNKNGCDETGNLPLKSLYSRIIKAIREVDTNHIIIIEGNCWGNNYKGLTPAFDKKMIYSFHKYWNPNTQGSIQWVLDLRDSLNVPVWLGESGENSNQWFTDCIRLMEKNQIGWSFWPLKKIGSVTGPLTIRRTKGYSQLLNYWNGKAEKPSSEEAVKWLNELIQNLRIENTIFHPDVIDAMFRQVHDNHTIAFHHYLLPNQIPFCDYDLGQNNFAYGDSSYQNIGRSRWNSGNSYRNDGVDIGTCEGSNPPSFFVGWTKKGEFLKYTFVLPMEKQYRIKIEAAAEKPGSKLEINCNGEVVSSPIEIPDTGGRENWKTFQGPLIDLHEGENIIRFNILEGGMNLKSFTLDNPS